MRPPTDYVFLVMGQNKSYKMAHVEEVSEKRVKDIPWNGHKYDFDRPKAYHVKGGFWFPWADLRWIRPFTMLKFLALVPKRVSVILHKEPEDPLHGVEIPLAPVLVRDTQAFDNMDEKGTMTMTTYHAQAYVESKIMSNYLKKMNFGGTVSWAVLAFVVIVVVVVLAIGLSTGYIKIGG